MTGAVDPGFNIDEVHREVLAELLRERGLDALSVEDRARVWRRWHCLDCWLDCWPDFPAGFARLRSRYICVSFTILSLTLIVDASRHNGITWDAVISCEMLRVYKPRPEAYRSVARLLQAEPAEILMVACHNFDLNAARAAGFRTALVHRPDEWERSARPIRSRTRPPTSSSTALPSWQFASAPDGPAPPAGSRAVLAGHNQPIEPRP